MKILVDTHTHTNCSTHAVSTLKENLDIAREKGLEMLVMTNHAPGLPDSPHIWHFQTFSGLPREVGGVSMLFGAECSIVDTDGNLDMPQPELSMMEVVIASLHQPLYSPRTIEEHTKTWENVVKNEYVHILGHSGSPQFEYDYEKIIKLAREYNKCIEINNHTFNMRKSSIKNCTLIAQLCKKIGTKIVVSSDAHSCWEVGCFDEALKMLEEIDFPEQLVMNTTAERFIDYISG